MGDVNHLFPESDTLIYAALTTGVRYRYQWLICYLSSQSSVRINKSNLLSFRDSLCECRELAGTYSTV